MKRKVYVLLSIMLIGMLVISGCGGSKPAESAAGTGTGIDMGKVYKIKIQAAFGPGFVMFDKLLPDYAAALDKASSGRIQLEIFGPDVLVPSSEMLQAVGSGALDMVYSSPIYYGGSMPAAELGWGIPLTLRTVDEFAYLWYDLGLIDVIRAEYAKHNTYLVGVAYSDPWGSTLSKRPVKTLEDFKGLKIRTSGIWGEVLQKFGASPTTLPASEIYTALATGVIDAVNFGSPAGFTAPKHHEVAKHYTSPAVVTWDMEDFYMNMDLWNSLPEDIQEIFRVCTIDFLHSRMVYVVSEDLKAVDEMKLAGVEFHKLPDSDVDILRKEALIMLENRSKRDEASKKVYDLVMKAIEQTNRYWDEVGKVMH